MDVLPSVISPALERLSFAPVCGREGLELHWEPQCDSCQKRKGLVGTLEWTAHGDEISQYVMQEPARIHEQQPHVVGDLKFLLSPAIKLYENWNILRNRAGFCCRSPPAQTPTGSSAMSLFLTSEIPRQLNTKQPENQWEGEHIGPFSSHKKVKGEGVQLHSLTGTSKSTNGGNSSFVVFFSP